MNVDTHALISVTEASELRLLSVPLVRTVTDSGRCYSLDEVVTELGVDLDALGDDD
jgi:hypothetical protein